MPFPEHESTTFRRLAFGASYGRTLDVLTARLGVFLSVGVILFIPYVLFNISVSKAVGEGLTQIMEATETQQNENNNNYNNYNNYNAGNDDDIVVTAFVDSLMHVRAELARLMVELILYALIGFVGGAALSRVVAELYVGNMISLEDAVRKAIQRFCKIFCAQWIAGLTIFVGVLVSVVAALVFSLLDNALGVILALCVYIALFVFVIYIQVAMMLLTPVVMVENKGPVDAFKRCWEMADQNRCYIYCTMFCFVFVTSFVLGIFYAIVFANDPMARYTTGGAILQTLQIIIVFPILIILSNVVYLNIRIEREGLNRDVLLKDLDDEQHCVSVLDDSNYDDGKVDEKADPMPYAQALLP